MVKRSKEKLTRHLSQPMADAYGIAKFATNPEANRWNMTSADLPKPPDAEKTRGVNEAISKSQSRWSYLRR